MSSKPSQTSFCLTADEILAYLGRADVETGCTQSETGETVGLYGDLQLRSAFQPLYDAKTLAAWSYEALLRSVNAAGEAVPPDQAFAIPETANEVVYFDRLCRTIHTMNFMAQAEPDEFLFLNVDGRHLVNVDSDSHGRDFSTLLSKCGLSPRRVVLEMLESQISDAGRLGESLAAYQQRGYRVAIDDFGCKHSNFDRLWQLSPDIVKLDRSLIVQSVTNPRAKLILPKLVDIVHDLGALAICEGIETAEQHALAIDSGVDLVQGFYYARPDARLQRGRRILSPMFDPDSRQIVSQNVLLSLFQSR